ncbi:MAG: peptidyl-alpha-hydroxyglycine alpha-amidating lyase family protein [Maricaulaceae bacterium]|jgi:sugar lactone lactonase YvrE
MSAMRKLAFGAIALWSASTAACAVGSGVDAMRGVGNPISGEGLPNPASEVIANWGELPAGREWGTSAGIDIDPIDGHIWAYERCGGGGFGGANCHTNPVDPIFKFDRNTGEVLANFGSGVMVTPHGIHVDSDGNVWVTDFAANEDGTKGHQVHKFSPTGELLLSLGVAGQPGTAPGQLNQPNDVITAPDGSIFVADGHNGQNANPPEGSTGRIIKFAADGTYLMEWGQIGPRHGEFRTPHALAFDSQGRLFVADRGNHRIEIFDQNGHYLESRYMFGRISGMFITEDDMLYAIDSESSPTSHPNWTNGVRIGPADEDRVTAFIPPFEREDRIYQGAAGEGVAVDADGNVYAAEGPNSMSYASGAFTKYVVAE